MVQKITDDEMLFNLTTAPPPIPKSEEDNFKEPFRIINPFHMMNLKMK